MAQTAPWHSVKSPKYHNNNQCTEGNNIERENRRSGTGGKTLCDNCKKLNAQGK